MEVETIVVLLAIAALLVIMRYPRVERKTQEASVLSPLSQPPFATKYPEEKSEQPSLQELENQWKLMNSMGKDRGKAERQKAIEEFGGDKRKALAALVARRQREIVQYD